MRLISYRKTSLRWIWVIPFFFGFLFLYTNHQIDHSITKSEANSIEHLGFMTGEVYTLPQVIESVSINSAQHAPLYFVLLSVWSKFVGVQPVMLRILSLYVGLLSLAIMYRLGQKLNRNYGGLLAVSLFFGVGFHLFYIAIIRMYALLMTISSLVIWSYAQINVEQKTVYPSHWVLLFFSSALLIYVHYFGIVLLVSLGIYHLLFASKNRRWFITGGVEIIAGVLFLPWLPVVMYGFGSRTDISDIRLSIVDSIYTIFSAHGNSFWWIIATVVLISLVSVIMQKHTQYQGYVLFITMSILGLMIFINEITPIIALERIRYTFVITPTLILSFCIVVLKLPNNILRTVVVVGWVVSGVWFYFSSSALYFSGLEHQDQIEYPPYELIYREYHDVVNENEVLVSMHDHIHIPNNIIDFYGQLLGLFLYHFEDEPPRDFYDNLIAEQQERLREDQLSLWLLHSPKYVDLDSLDVYQTLRESFKPCATVVRQPSIQLDYYLNNDIPCTLADPLSEPLVSYDDGLILQSISATREGDVYTVFSNWRQVSQKRYGASIQFFDTSQAKVVQQDWELTDHPIQILEVDVAGLEEETYSVQLIVYEIETSRSLSGMLIKSGDVFEREYHIADFTNESLAG